MRSTPKKSIKSKLTKVIMVASVSVLLVTVIAFMVYDLVTFRQTMVQNLNIQAKILAENSNGSMAFHDKADAMQVLASLRAEPHILVAAIYDAQGKLFAKYPASTLDADLPAAPESRPAQFEKKQLTLFQPIMQSGASVGTLYLRSDIRALSQRFILYAAISISIMAGALLLAWWLSHTLEKQISDPIIALAKTVRNFSDHGGVVVPALKNNDDEVGDLTEAFNAMFHQIQASHADLEKSRAQLQIVTDHASVLLCHLDQHQIYHFVNPAYAARFNLIPKAVIGRHVRDVVGAAAYQSIANYIARVLAGEQVEYELEVPYETVGRRWMHCIYIPEKNHQGEVVGFVGVINDVSARKRNEAELAELVRQTEAQAKLFDTTLSSITDLAYTFDLEGNWIYANKPLLQLWGKSLAQIVGKSSWDLGYPPELAERLRQQVQEVVRTRKPLKGETYFTDATGREDYHEYIFSPVMTADGRVMAVCGTTRLTTESKRAAMELERARDQALAASRAKDDFLAALSHELRTPLNPVLLVASDAASNRQLPAEICAQFEMIRRNVELEARLIDDLLDLTRITRGKLALEKRVLNVLSTLQDAIAIIQPDAIAKKIGITLDFDLKQPMIFGDPIRLQQIFWNVLKNAVKFTPDGGEIAVATKSDPTTGRVTIKIMDTGMGLTANEIARVFDAFAQGEHAVGNASHRFGGLGLGLTISRLLVELHSGVIQAASRGRDQGATFTIELPPASAELQPIQSSVDGSLTEISQSVELHRPHHILLVEDHEPTRIALTQLLTRRHYLVKSASTIAEARILSKQEKFDLLISDIGLPDGEGYTLMAELRGAFGIKGIAISGYGMEQDVTRAQLSGFSAHLLKPVRVEALEKVLSEVA